ncbi:D-beta-hydroxybutyrate dehydrogenase, mitochondrial-like [Argiope bruennichi]|uniref:D-beta-hydroxybutyrate dehydrogenase, mitochondrial-like n=1 Tax=Argiope bruennichi TaxID=94029 RepID=UPI002493E8FD|nr:D-beta-hydroxybutyrate dehydrogenase, mitochondrial-like [Argiope bruennichi]
MDIWITLTFFVLAGLLTWISRRRTFVRPDGVAIFISGCDSGIGRKLAEYFAEMGCLVFAGCLDPNNLNSLPDNVRTVKLNLMDEDSVREAVAAVKSILVKEKKELWALVNNAGVCVYGPFEWQTARQRDWQVDVNLKGTMRLTRECIPLLRRSRGRIITVSSVNGNIAYPGLAVYSATKFALEGFSDALRIELGPRHGIRVIIVQPGDYARITSLMSNHKRHALEMWNDMASEEQEQVKTEFQKYHAAVLQNYGLSSPTSWERSPLLQDMKEAMFGENPSSRYLSAPFAHRLIYRALALSPHQYTDFLLIKIAKLVIDSADNGKNVSSL